MSVRTLLALIVTLAIPASAALSDQVSPPAKQDTILLIQEDVRSLGLSITIIRLKWADADELAAKLAPILLAGYKVVAYPPLNALIISRDPTGPPSPRP
jgi:hypothetical protein